MRETTDIASFIATIFDDAPLSATFSNPKEKGGEFSRATLRLLDNGLYQAEERRGKQAFHKNMPAGDARTYATELMDTFRQLNAKGAAKTFELRLSKKGIPHLNSRTNPPAAESGHLAPAGNDRLKSHILDDRHMPPVFCDLGISTPEGVVKPSKRDKYRQVCRFLEIVDDVIGGTTPDGRPLEVVDFGCGKSYLTFGVYHYLHELRGLPVHMSGLDLKADVIQHCSALAKTYGYDGLEFAVGDIAQWDGSVRPDMVIMLHACDTATDFGLANALSWHTGTILSVPCCQHELAAQIASDELHLLTRYGIIKERTAALMTDAIRANLLAACGYKTQLLEFVDEGNTPKNLMIRATRAQLPEPTRQTALQEVEELCGQFNLTPTLLTLLREAGLLPQPATPDEEPLHG